MSQSKTTNTKQKIKLEEKSASKALNKNKDNIMLATI